VKHLHLLKLTCLPNSGRRNQPANPLLELPWTLWPVVRQTCNRLAPKAGDGLVQSGGTGTFRVSAAEDALQQLKDANYVQEKRRANALQFGDYATRRKAEKSLTASAGNFA
jgi:hypothetical protein